jgi:predicted enzyme related to lactoylglutathione lyase
MVHVPDWRDGFSWYRRAFSEAKVRGVQSGKWQYLELDGICLELVNSDEKVPSGVAGTVVNWSSHHFDERLAYLFSIGATLYRGPMEIAGNLRICQVMDPFGNVFGIREIETVG